MAAKRAALGRGLAALLGDAAEVAEAALAVEAEAVAVGEDAVPPSTAIASPEPGRIVDLPVSSIRRNPQQPRRAFDPEALSELATSIGSVGVVQPVIVRQVEDGYELIAGERRWRAAQMAGYTVVPAIIRKASDVESLELALIENVVRQQLNPVDEAYALKVLLEDLGVTQDNLAARVGRSRSAIANKIRLLDLPAPIQESLASGAMSEGHGRALLGLSERGRQLQLARRVVEKGMSVRQVEEEVRRLSTKTQNASAQMRGSEEPAYEALDPAILEEIQQAFFSAVGVMPRVKVKNGGGVIELRFKDSRELRDILGRLGS